MLSLSFIEAKELIAEHEAIEKELRELVKAQTELYKQMEDKKARLKAIEANFLPKEKEDELVKAKLMKAAIVEAPKTVIAAPVEAPKEEVKASPYRIKGDK